MFFLPLRSLPISHLSIDTDAIIHPIRNSPTQAFCVASVLDRPSSQSSAIHILKSTRTQLVLTQDLHLHYNRLRNCATIQLFVINFCRLETKHFTPQSRQECCDVKNLWRNTGCTALLHTQLNNDQFSSVAAVGCSQKTHLRFRAPTSLLIT